MKNLEFGRRPARVACGLAAVLALFALAPVTAHAGDWAGGSQGSIPFNANVAGNEANGEPLAACRAWIDGGLHPGKIRNGFSGCNIGYGGQERTVNFYEVLVDNANWMSANGGILPGGVIQSGKEANGQPLYVCRAQYNGGLHPGKIRLGFSGCNIGYGGREVTVPFYDVMVY